MRHKRLLTSLIIFALLLVSICVIVGLQIMVTKNKPKFKTIVIDKDPYDVTKLTFKDLLNKGYCYSEYTKENDHIVITMHSKDNLIHYKLISKEATKRLSEENASEIFYGQLIKDCSIDTYKVFVLKEDIQKTFLSKTVKELLNKGYIQTDFRGYDILILTNDKENITIAVTLNPETAGKLTNDGASDFQYKDLSKIMEDVPIVGIAYIW